MKTVLSEVVAHLAPTAVIDVFGSYGMRVEPLREGPKSLPPNAKKILIAPKDAPAEATVAGVVGFTGLAMRGTLLLATAFEVIAAARPGELRQRTLSKKSASDWILVRDWAGELANQVLGRIKNRLHRYGVSFDVSPPTALSGTALAFASPRGPAPQLHIFMAGEQQVRFCFDAIFDPGRKVSAEGPEGEASEGKVILFD
jgi:CheY-specific phosphatase CheX